MIDDEEWERIRDDTKESSLHFQELGNGELRSLTLGALLWGVYEKWEKQKILLILVFDGAW